MRLRIRTAVDSRPPFDGERYWRWEVYCDGEDFSSRIRRCVGWTRTKTEALRLARLMRKELRR